MQKKLGCFTTQRKLIICVSKTICEEWRAIYKNQLQICVLSKLFSIPKQIIYLQIFCSFMTCDLCSWAEENCSPGTHRLCICMYQSASQRQFLLILGLFIVLKCFHLQPTTLLNQGQFGEQITVGNLMCSRITNSIKVILSA